MHKRGRGFLFRFDKYKVVASKKSLGRQLGRWAFSCNNCLKIACLKKNSAESGLANNDFSMCIWL